MAQAEVMRAAVSGALLLATLGCKTPPEPKPEPRAPSSPAPANQGATPQATAKGLVWDDPADWTKEPRPRPMRLATYRVPKTSTDPEDAELAVFHFGPGDGGGIEANVTRWVGQFSEVPASDVLRTERQTSSGLAVHVVEVPRGTYASGMPGGPTTPKPEHGLLGAIVPSPAGSYFFKLTGPSALLQRERDKFFLLLDSVRADS